MLRRLVASSLKCLRLSQHGNGMRSRETRTVLPRVMQVSSWQPKEEEVSTESSTPKVNFLPGYEEIEQLKSANKDVQMIFDMEYASRKDQIKLEMAKLVDRYKHKEGDTGAIEVQVAALSLRIKKMMEHLRINRKDYSCKRSMLHLVHRRRKLLLLLKSLRPNSYHDILQDLKLRHPVNPIFQLKQHPGRKKK